MADFDPQKYVSPTMLEEDVIALKDVFDALDSSGDGKIERSELMSAILTMGIPMDEVTGGSMRELTHGPDGASSVMDFDTFVRVVAAGQEKGGANLTAETLFQIFVDLDKKPECRWFEKTESTRKAMQRTKKDPVNGWAMKGALTWEDLKGLAEDLGEQVDDDYLKDMVSYLDADEDGVVGPDDFYNAIHHATQAIAQTRKRAEEQMVEEAVDPTRSSQSFVRTSSFQTSQSFRATQPGSELQRAASGYGFSR
jgi:Ca2+-binding EF-hand superfamily protein